MIRTKYRAFIFGGIIVLLVTAVLLRFKNITEYLLYSDSYQSLIVAQNLQSGQGLIGTMGALGSEYPQYFGWTRPLLPLLINATSSLFNIEPVTAGRLIAFVCGIIIVPATYWAVYSVYKNQRVALCGLTLSALSFSLVMWSGILLTETLSILLQLLIIVSLAYYVRGDRKWLLLTGILLGLAVATRYEYIVLALPLLLCIKRLQDTPLFCAGFAATAAVIYMLVMPLAISPAYVLSASTELLLQVIKVLIAGLIAYIIWQTSGTKIKKIVNRAKAPEYRIIRAIVTFLLFIGVVIYIRHALPGLQKFVSDDILLVFCTFFGVIALNWRNRYALSGLLAAVLLASMYTLVNEKMERYWSHLIPLMLICGSYGIYTAAQQIKQHSYRTAWFASIGFWIIVQFSNSFVGFTARSDVWQQQGYEQVAAQRIQPYVAQTDVLVVSMPEPYRLYNKNISVRTLYRQAPYLKTRDLSNTDTITIINDAGMKRYFPEFYEHIEQHAQKYLVAELSISEPLRVIDEVYEKPVAASVYTISVLEFEKFLTVEQ